ncbi:hypothetical protein FQN54_001529 [Arachnomyces sp. PD_36]|nr:hypothetical protein FQN54_001529 [Arachnomyces sp. PD_36]
MSQAHHHKTGWGAWRTELLALTWSVLSFLVMVILLVIFDGRPVFTWKSVTLNAIIAVVSASMKASLTFAMAELIGQWKWILFSRASRPLMDFERMDMASRGPLGIGSPTDHQRVVAIILLAIGIEPFSQQLLQLQEGIEFTDSPTYGEPAARTTGVEEYNKGDWDFINRTTSAKDPETTMVTANTRLELAMQTVILGGLSRSREVVNQQAHVQCPTGICFWDQFQTLGVCSRCNDLTSELERVNDFGDVYDAAHNKDYEREYAKKDATAFVLPNGHFLMNINECSPTASDCYYFSPFIGSSIAETSSMNSFGTGDPRKTNSMKDINTLIWSMSVIHLNTEEYSESEWPNVSLSATECAIYYCVKTIETRVDGNIIHENATEATDAVRNPDSWELRSSFEYGAAPENVPPDNKNATLEFHKYHSAAQRDDLVISFPNNSSKPNYTLSYTAVWSVSQFIQELLSTDLIENDNVTEAISKSKFLPNDTARYNGMLDNSGMGEPAAADNVWGFDKPDIPDTFATLATSMTNRLREPDLTDDLTFSVFGRVGRPTKYYKTQ